MRLSIVFTLLATAALSFAAPATKPALAPLMAPKNAQTIPHKYIVLLKDNISEMNLAEHYIWLGDKMEKSYKHSMDGTGDKLVRAYDMERLKGYA